MDRKAEEEARIEVAELDPAAARAAKKLPNKVSSPYSDTASRLCDISLLLSDVRLQGTDLCSHQGCREAGHQMLAIVMPA